MQPNLSPDRRSQEWSLTVRQPIELVFNVFRVSADLLDEFPVLLVIVTDGRCFFRPINQEAVSCLAEWAQDDKEALDVFKALGRRVLDLRAIYEIDVPCSRTSAMRGPSTSAVQRPALGRFGFGWSPSLKAASSSASSRLSSG